MESPQLAPPGCHQGLGGPDGTRPPTPRAAGTPGRTWPRPAGRGERARCFWLGTRQPAGVLLWVARHKVKMPLIRERAARFPRTPLRSGAEGARRAGGGTPVTRAPRGARTPERAQTRRRQPRARQPPAARDCSRRPYLLLQCIFSFNLVTGTEVPGRSFAAFATKYLLCW